MKKKLLSLALALALCLGLTVPAMAAGATVTEIVSPDTYQEFLGKYIAYMQEFHEGIAWHGSSWTGYGAFDATGKVIVPPGTYREVTEFHDGVAWGQPRRGGPWVAVDTSGRELFSLEGITNDQPARFSDGLARVTASSREGIKYGYVDKTGKLAIPFESRSGADFHDGLAVVYDYASASYGYMDKTGSVAIPCQYAAAEDFSDGFAQVKLGDQWICIDTAGRKVNWIPEGCSHISRVSPEVMLAYNPNTYNQKYVFCDKSGKAISGVYDSCRDSGDGIYTVGKNKNSSYKEYGYVNEAGKEIVPCALGHAADFHDGFAIARTGSDGKGTYSYSIYDKTGRVTGTWTGKTNGGGVGGTNMTAGNGCFRISSRESGGERFGFIDYTGREIVPPKYKEVGDFSGGVAPVQSFDNKWGFVDTTGAEVVPCKLDGCIAHDEPGVFEVCGFNGDNRWSIVKSSGWTAPAVSPAKPSPQPAKPAASGVSAAPTSASVLVNGKSTAFDAYSIGGANYFKLRDLAFVLSGTGKQFEVGWDGAANAISLTSGQAYTAVGGEMSAKGSGAKQAKPSTAKILLDGQEVSLTAYEIGGNNYFKLRDIGQAFDFGIGWDDASRTITIDTSTGYTAG